MSILKTLFKSDEVGYYTSIAGITNAIFYQYTEGSACVYRQLLSIFNYFNLEYYLFAGSMVGYVRNGEMPPWMDDLDIIIFEDQIKIFENKVIPHLIKSGFNVISPSEYPGGGYHILALQQGGNRDVSSPFSSGINVTVPWAQIDVFYTKVDEAGYIRNPSGWGLYHLKNIPVDWVKPGRKVEVSGLKVNTFSRIEDDILKEYGDVNNNLVVATHNITYLRVDNVPWRAVEKEYSDYLAKVLVNLTPSVTQKNIADYVPLQDKIFYAEPNKSFDEILLGVVSSNSSEVVFSQRAQLFWAMDLKRILPNCHVRAVIKNSQDACIATHLRSYYDSIESDDKSIRDLIDGQIMHLNLKVD